ncbi:MAG: FAD-dependent oxidoreductase [Chitinophagaceae bacterium]|nr:FAD-dependent oxidoreductase [Chitinophagaceae bacterium]
MEIKEHVHCLIIGSGPAGYTAAIYAARAGLNPVLYQGIQPGGQLTITTEVENYPGYADGVQGPEMMVHFEKQAARMGADIRFGIVTKVDFAARPFKVEVDEEKWLSADAVIISTGASAKWNKEVAIVGAGDTACEEALYLSKICSHVHMIVRKGEEGMRASKVMQDRVKATANITIYWNSETDEVLGSQKVEGVRIKNNKTNTLQEVPVSAFFVAIGHQPNSAIFKDWLDMDETGYIKTVPGTSKTNIEGVFAAGDVQDKIYRQAVTAAGSGCMAALDAERFLGEHHP